MTVRKTPNGRWRGQVKAGRAQVTSKTFDTRREATAWVMRERAAIAGGVDPRAGKQRVRDLLSEWLEVRKASVAARTYRADADLVRLLPTAIGAMSVAAVTDREVQRALVAMSRRGLAESSIERFRASLSSFFGWCVRERLILTNPVRATHVPRQTTPSVELYPFSEAELEGVVRAVAEHNIQLSRVVLVAGWTGLRWSELRAVRVRDFVRVPLPLLVIERAAPEGVGVKQTKGRRVRRVPVADRVLSIVESFAQDKGPNDLLFTTDGGAQLHATPFRRTTRWPISGEGRRVHDLRHTAACLWLARGVDPATVQAWMGHASIGTTNIYIRHLGTGADRAGLDRLNSGFEGRGCAGGAPDAEEAE
jgi:integrase